MQKDKFTFFLIDRLTVSDAPDESNIIDSLAELRSLLADNLLPCVSIVWHRAFKMPV